MADITWQNKIEDGGETALGRLSAAEANEIKSAVNSKADKDAVVAKTPTSVSDAATLTADDDDFGGPFGQAIMSAITRALGKPLVIDDGAAEAPGGDKALLISSSEHTNAITIKAVDTEILGVQASSVMTSDDSGAMVWVDKQLFLASAGAADAASPNTVLGADQSGLPVSRTASQIWALLATAQIPLSITAAGAQEIVVEPWHTGIRLAPPGDLSITAILGLKDLESRVIQVKNNASGNLGVTLPGTIVPLDDETATAGILNLHPGAGSETLFAIIQGVGGAQRIRRMSAAGVAAPPTGGFEVPAVISSGIVTASTPNITIPPRAVGDLHLVFAERHADNTPIPLPAGWSSTTEDGTVMTFSSPSRFIRVAWRVAEATNETAPEFTGAQRIIYIPYENVDPAAPVSIGNIREIAAGGSQVIYDAMALPDQRLVVAGHHLDGSQTAGLPQGLTSRAERQPGAVEMQVGDTEVMVSSWAARSAAKNGTGRAWSFAIALKGKEA